MKHICDTLRDLVAFVKLKNVKNTHEGVLLLVKLQAKACNFTKSNTPPWVFFTFFKLYKCYQIAQRTTFGDMGESSDSINGILLENIDKEIPINFSLLTTPVKDTPSNSKTSTISKLENYIDKSYDEAAKIQLKEAILREVKQQVPNETKEKGHLDELLPSLHSQIFSLKSEIGFLSQKLHSRQKLHS